MPYKQKDLPYALQALAPFISEEQMHYHYNKHHAAYFANLNKLIQGKTESTLEEIVKNSSGALFNNAAQAWNHTFFWDCMSPNGGGAPQKTLMEAIERDFGSFGECMQKFSHAALTLFGSGWVWLVKDSQGKLEIVPLGNADTPLKYGKTPILTLDVWEHAYYIDYKNERNKFVEKFQDVIHWDFVGRCYTDLGMDKSK